MVDFFFSSHCIVFSNVYFLKKLYQKINENPKVLIILLYNDACWYKGKMFLIEMCGDFSADVGVREKLNSLLLKETLKIQVLVSSSKTKNIIWLKKQKYIQGC